MDVTVASQWNGTRRPRGLDQNCVTLCITIIICSNIRTIGLVTQNQIRRIQNRSTIRCTVLSMTYFKVRHNNLMLVYFYIIRSTAVHGKNIGVTKVKVKGFRHFRLFTEQKLLLSLVLF